MYMEYQDNVIHSVRKKVLFGVILLVVCICAVIWVVSVTQPKDQENNVSNVEQIIIPTLITEVQPNNAPDPLPNDTDRDGIENEKEMELGLSMVNPDTDGDGLSDNEEVGVWKSDPLLFDSDGDGFGDGWEVLKGYNPIGTGSVSTTIN
jgi:hypothetical protein